ncbi:MAG: 6-phosphogluconolactonase, cycloisomerase 2 family [Acidobacteriaceae bacterium]|nr:6-phosphogluconolactonase, cycloisomerase 2 family [Acidobacteriaceae bacterium]
MFLKLTNPLRLLTSSIALTIPLFLALTAQAAPTLVVLSPGTGSFDGAPVFYEAYATSPSCAFGISAMRIYTAPGVSAYTTSGAHIETFINLKPGRYNTVVQAWDNCGGVAKTNVSITVNSTAGVTVYMPNGPVGNVPNHFAASAVNPACPAGIAAMRLYTANNTTPYTVHSNQLNAFVNVNPGNYYFTVLAYDKCGHVLKFAFNQFVTTSGQGYFYTTNKRLGNVAEFQFNDGKLTNPNGSGHPPLFPAGANVTSIAVDPGGWFAYALSDKGITTYQINQNNGALMMMPGVVSLNGQGPAEIIADPNGNFVFVAYHGSNTVSTYKVNRSTGALLNTSIVQLSGGIVGVHTDFTGQYVYAINQNFNSTQIFGYRINFDNGGLSAVPGSPYALPNNAHLGGPLTSTKNYLYAVAASSIYGYAVNYGTGALTALPGSPFGYASPFLNPQSALADSRGRYVWTADASTDSAPAEGWFTRNDIMSGTGSLGPFYDTQTGGLAYPAIVEDPSGLYLYTWGVDQNNCFSNNCPALVSSWTISSNGDPVLLSGPLKTGDQNALLGGIAIAKKFGD